MHEDREHCLRAVRSHDARFDGWFFTATSPTELRRRASRNAGTPAPGGLHLDLWATGDHAINRLPA